MLAARFPPIPMRVPVLAYHAVNIAGTDYASNDLVAFAADLRLIDDLGLRIVPLQWVAEQVTGAASRNLDRCVALTCDDGSAFDFHDLVHPVHGPQRSLYHCLLDFIAERGDDAQPDLHLTSFVIASPEARERMDQVCLAGLGWMDEDWWRKASGSGLMAIENHSWDHNHPCLILRLVACRAVRFSMSTILFAPTRKLPAPHANRRTHRA